MFDHRLVWDSVPMPAQLCCGLACGSRGPAGVGWRYLCIKFAIKQERLTFSFCLTSSDLIICLHLVSNVPGTWDKMSELQHMMKGRLYSVITVSLQCQCGFSTVLIQHLYSVGTLFIQCQYRVSVRESEHRIYL